MVLIVEFAVALIMKDNGWEIVEDIVDVIVFVELWIGGLTSNSSVLRVVSWCA